MKYVSDVISEDEFKNWKPGQRVFITASTGAGKSYFILYKLLIDRVIEKGEKILYLVNRRILKEQLEKEIKFNVLNRARKKYRTLNSITNFIEVETYQNIEQRIKNMVPYNFSNLINFINSFHIIVYDECHYFYMDSDFNTYTELSYDCFRRHFCSKIQIFISATMEKVKLCIDEYNQKYFLNDIRSFYLNIEDYGIIPVFPMINENQGPADKEFSVNADYSYVKINVFDQYEDLIKIISENMESKWLIFIDSIEKGKDLQKGLISVVREQKGNQNNALKKEDIVLIDAEFKRQESANNAIQEIVEYKKVTGKKILISTSVMDNGISIFDNELRNLVILYDTEEEFIQMLGRKRKDGESINLYICKRNSNYFRLRLQGVKRKINFYNKYTETIDEMYRRRFSNKNCSYDCSINCKMSCVHYCNNATNCYNKCWISCPNSCRIQCNKNCKLSCKNLFYVTPYFDLLMSVSYSNYRNAHIESFIKMFYMQQSILNEILDNSFRNYMLYSLQGFIAINYFSIRKILDLFEFYSDMKEKIENDEFAFVKEQMRWMNIEEDKINKTIMEMAEGDDDKYRKVLIENTEKILNQEFDAKENKEFKEKIKDTAIYFVKKSRKKEDSIIKYLKQNDRTIVEEQFNECMKNAGLNYKMTKSGQKFKINKIENTEV